MKHNCTSNLLNSIDFRPNLLVKFDGKLIVVHGVLQLVVLSNLVQFFHLQHKLQQLL